MMAPAADAEDLSIQGAAYAENVDFYSMPGTVRGYDRWIERYGVGSQVRTFPVVLDYGDGNDPLIVYWRRGGDEFWTFSVDGNTITNEDVIASSRSTEAYDSSAFREAVRFGFGTEPFVSRLPAWIGYPTRDQFGTSKSATPVLEAAALRKPSNQGFDITLPSGNTTTTDPTFFVGDARYKYYLALQYDGYQEGPLEQLASLTLTSDAKESIDYTIEYDDGVTLSERVTALQLYREGPLEKDAVTDLPASPELIATIPLDDGGWSAAAPGQTYDGNDDGSRGQGYEQRTGIPPTLDDMLVLYELTTMGGGYHFVGRCGLLDGDETHRSAVFRSKAYRPDMFDWTADYIVLDEEPRALYYWNGELLVFCPSALYHVDPDSLSVVRTSRGYSTFGPLSVTSSPEGVFWCDEHSVYFYDGQRIRNIGGPIRQSEDGSFDYWPQDLLNWASDDYRSPQCHFIPKLRLFVIVGHMLDNSIEEGWAWHLPDRRWTEEIPRGQWSRLKDYAEPGTAHKSYGMVNVDGRPFLISNGSFHEAFADDDRLAWTWRSARIDLDRPGIYKAFYEAHVKGNANLLFGDGEFRWRSDRGGWSTPVAFSSVAVLNGRCDFSVNSQGSAPFTDAMNLQIEITGEGGSGDRLRAVSITYRIKQPFAED